ncbi:hypothetical protein SK128_012805 [Halocaridina rubra]|uniref:Uncharacterized protein n=1 Tax=Halocaridina rubra TaxID=373956 RepID=A0AAN8WX91_HALRR
MSLVLEAAHPFQTKNTTGDQQIMSEAMMSVAARLMGEELNGCTLTLIGGSLETRRIFSQLATLLNIPYQMTSKQLDPGQRLDIRWIQSICDAFFIFIQKEEEENEGEANDLLLAKTYLSSTRSDIPWNYNGKYIFFNFAGRRITDAAITRNKGNFGMENLATTHLLQKTQNVLFIWEHPDHRRAEISTHWLYSDRPFRYLTTYQNSRFSRNVDFFPDKVSNLHGFPLVAKAFSHAPSVFGNLDEDGITFHPSGGEDVEFVRHVAKYLNASLVWKHPGPELWGNLFPNNTYTGLVGQVAAGDGDIGVANVFITFTRSLFTSFSYPYTYDRACFITPAPRPLPRWISLILPFTPLSSEAPIKTIAQLAKSNLWVLGASNYWKILFSESNNPYLHALTPKYIDVFNTVPSFRDIAEKGDAVLVENRNHLEYIQKRFYTTKTGESPLRLQEECITTYSVGALMVKNSALKASVDRVIHYMQSAAFMSKFYSDVLRQHSLDTTHENKGPSWLDMHDGELREGPQVDKTHIHLHACTEYGSCAFMLV